MSDNVNKKLAGRLFDAMNEKDMEEIDALCDDERLREAQHRFLGAFPDLRLQTGWMIAEGDLVATWVEFEGTHDGPFRGVPPTGKSVRSAAIYVLRVRDGRFIDYWLGADFLGMLHQIGAVQVGPPLD
jgi:predicted ester cyclase